MNYVVDTSVIVEKAISKLIEKKKLDGKLIIHRAVVAELEHQANTGRETGLLGLDELQKLQELKEKGKIKLEIMGDRPNSYQKRYAKGRGEIDSMILELAYNEGATLITADLVQAESAKAMGLKVNYLELKVPKEKIEIEEFFDNKTMSVHLKEDCFVQAKKGGPGAWNLEKVSKKKLKQEDLERIAKEIVEMSRIDPKALVEISRKSSTIVQYKNYRIVIVRPPVSDGWEITAVKPLKTLKLEDYDLPETILSRLKERAQGVLIAGETGSGKSTLAQSIADNYAKNGRITKTIESPRDLMLSDEVTQYSQNFASSQELHDILFLSRPDNLIFDEVRDTPDFRLYIDLRLAGSSVIGVLHSSSPIDAVNRFISRLDTGMIPSVIDTILFIEKGVIGKVLTLKLLVKVPTGMTESDLARPVVEVRDFINGKLEYEIYSYGEETVVIPVNDVVETSPLKELAKLSIEEEFLNYVDNVKVEILNDRRAEVFIPSNSISKIIGKQGKNIEKIEQDLGISISIRELEGAKTEFKVIEKKKNIVFRTSPNQEYDILVNSQLLFTAKSSKKGEIKVHKKSKIGCVLLEAIDLGRKIELKG